MTEKSLPNDKANTSYRAQENCDAYRFWLQPLIHFFVRQVFQLDVRQKAQTHIDSHVNNGQYLWPEFDHQLPKIMLSLLLESAIQLTDLTLHLHLE